MSASLRFSPSFQLTGAGPPALALARDQTRYYREAANFLFSSHIFYILDLVDSAALLSLSVPGWPKTRGTLYLSVPQCPGPVCV